LKAVFPHLETFKYAYANTKIAQLAVVFYETSGTLASWVDGEGRLLTAPLEEYGRGLLFLPQKRLAQKFFRLIKGENPSARLVIEDREEYFIHSDIEPAQEARCLISYSRGVLGAGVNVDDLCWMVLDCDAFRALSSFNPALLTPESYKVSRTQERLALLIQNLGRLLRGKEGRRCVLILLNADSELEEALRNSESIREAVEQPPIFRVTTEQRRLIFEAAAWLAGGAEFWPLRDASEVPAEKTNGRPRRTKEDIQAAAEKAIAEGVTWPTFRKTVRPERFLDATELEELKALFPQ
jgi:hypothetical protein